MSAEQPPGSLAPPAEGVPPNTTSPVRPRRRRAVVVISILVGVAVVAAGVWIYTVYTRPHSGPGRNTAAGFADGRVLTVRYSGNYTCAPDLLAFFPSALAAAARTGCEIGRSDPSAGPHAAPVWLLVPAFAGLSVFGLQALGASARGMPMFAGSPWLADCGGGGGPTACANHPAAMYAPGYLTLERALGFVSGPEGLPLGVLPTPAFDTLVNVTPPRPAAAWSTVVVWVFDPNVFPNRTDATCQTLVPSGLAAPSAHCLTSLASLVAALGTPDTAVPAANAGNPLWQAWGKPSSEAVVLSGPIYAPNTNLYVSLSMTPGAPKIQPS